MTLSRREFVIVSTAAACATALAVETQASSSPTFPGDGPAWIEGDPYTAHASGPGLGGRSFEAAKHQALSTRLPADERDRYVLGLELDHA
ncbi:MAG TPA: hypothetical protein VNM92_18500 [Thermoanaerobaculia bacterium]|nr:hypothetical protein [Thermoanaerobaculia bacterium]